MKESKWMNGIKHIETIIQDKGLSTAVACMATYDTDYPDPQWFQGVCDRIEHEQRLQRINRLEFEKSLYGEKYGIPF
jgi:hypothetical protein